jgi:hypothetical protein
MNAVPENMENVSVTTLWVKNAVPETKKKC